MAEQIFLNEGNILVTDARLNIASQTYSVRNITSFKTDEHKPNTQGSETVAGVGFVLGLILGGLVGWGPSDSAGAENGVLAGAITFAVIVAPFFIVGLLWRRAQKSTYSLVLNTASGEVQAITSKDKDFVLKIATSLGDAIVARTKAP